MTLKTPILYIDIGRISGADPAHQSWEGVFVQIGIWRLRFEFSVGWR